MKKITSTLKVVLMASILGAFLTSCFGWYDWLDDPYGPPPPPPRHHNYHHHHHHY